jgi:hypothetical protein
MSPEAFLTTCAEIGITLAGFSGIAAVLGRRGQGEWSELDAFRMRLLLRASFGAVVFSLLPIGLAAAGLSEPHVWGAASGLFFVWLAFNVARSIVKERSLLTTASETIERSYLAFFFATPFVNMALHVANLTVLRTAWPYLFGLLLALIVGFAQFVRLLRGLWPQPRSDG